MYIKKLSFLISKVLVAGCVSFAFTGTASAYSYGYWQGISPTKLGQYKFRPVENQKPSAGQLYRATRFDRPRVSSVFSRFQTPSFSHMRSAYSLPAGFAMPRPIEAYRSNLVAFNSPARVIAENRRYYQPGRYSRPLQPAFARQYGWAPATKMVVRKGGVSDHFASQVNDGFAQQTVAADISEYRSEPVTSQGFNYRTIRRNPGHVSFADKLRHLVPQPHRHRVVPQQKMNAFRPESRVAVKPDNWQKPPVPVMAEQRIKPVVNNKLVQVNTSGYRFRPDARFEVSQQPAYSSVMPVSAPVNAAAPEDFQLADAKIESGSMDTSKQWFFRPSQPSSF